MSDSQAKQLLLTIKAKNLLSRKRLERIRSKAAKSCVLKRIKLFPQATNHISKVARIRCSSSLEMQLTCVSVGRDRG